MLYNILLIVQILVALGIIGLVLIQHGKGADAGAAFGVVHQHSVWFAGFRQLPNEANNGFGDTIFC